MMRRRSAYFAGFATGIMILASLTATADSSRPAAAGPPPSPAAAADAFEPSIVALPTDNEGWVRTDAPDTERTAAPAAIAPNGMTGGPVAACVPRQPICLPFTVVDNRGYVAPPNDVMEAIPFTIQAGNRITIRLQNLSTSDGSRCLSKGVRKPDGTLLDGQIYRACPFHDQLFEFGPILPDGTYTLLLDAGQQAGATGRVDVTIHQTPPDTTEALPAIGTEKRVTIEAPGQRAFRSFTGSQGQTLKLTIDPGDNFNNDPNDQCRLSAVLRVVKPDGSNLYPAGDGNWACVRSQITVPLSLPQNGTYWIKIDPDFWAIGSIDLKLSRIGAVTRCDPSSVMPIIMVHGFNEQPAVFNTMQQFLTGKLTDEFRRDGFPATEAAACAPGYLRAIEVGRRGSSRANAEIIKTELADLLAATGKPRADIIAHSKGGLDSRVAVATLQNPQSVRNLAMIGTPNGGARMAAVGCGVPNFPALEQTDREFRAVAQNVLSTLFGECNGPEDGLYGLTEDFVQNELNPATPDNPNVFYTTIFGDASQANSSCAICQAMLGLMGPNDIIVPVHSALHLRGRGYWPIGPFQLDHDQLLTSPAVHLNLVCVVLADRTRPDRTCDRDDRSPQTPFVGNAAHIDAVPVPANGGSKTITLPVKDAGLGGIFVLSDGTGLTATAREGTSPTPTPLDRVNGFYGEMLLGDITGAADVTLTITNSSAVPRSVMVGVGTIGARELDIVLTPEVPRPGQPVQIRVPGQTPAGLFGFVTAPNGAETTLTFAGSGSDSVATFTPSRQGQFRVAVGHKGTNQARRFGFNRLVVGAGAASLPGTLRTSLTRSGSDNLADALNIDVDVTVQQAGQYTLSAALQTTETTDGRLIAHTKTTKQLAAGTSAVRLTYRGPVIYGANPSAPFRLTDVTLLRPGDIVEARAARLDFANQYPRDTFRPTRIDPGFVDVTEGGPAARTTVRVPATLSERINAPVIVNFGSYMQDGSATWPEDYDPVLGNMVYLPGETSKMIPLTIKGDDLDENDEAAFILFNGAVNATIGGFHVGGANIKDDDPLPVIQPGFAPATVEGNSGTKTVQVPVTLSAPSGRTVTVQYSAFTQPGGWAVFPGDFDVVPGTLTFQPGQTSKTITLTIKGDTLDENDEGALIALGSPVNATVGGFGVAGVTIIDDD